MNIEEAIERLDYFEPDDLVECAMYRDCVETIKNLIEKKQKEIEELKENKKQKYYHVVKSKELEEEINNAWEDKIKVKIEDIKQDENFYRERDRMYEYEGKLTLLQSLLKKE